MTGLSEQFDAVVLGAGLRGLVAALRMRREQPGASLLVVDLLAQPGGGVRTQRTNGFVCELGPFAFPADELDAVAALLERPPTRLECLPAARTGHLFSGDGLVPIEVSPLPWSFRSGSEELVQACRRQLGDVFRLGRAAVAVDRSEQFAVALGGEVPTTVRTPRLVVALPESAAGRLLARFDPALAGVAARIVTTPTAMAFFAGLQHEGTLRGYGIVPADGVATPVREVIFCSEVFPGRALPGRFLVRVECEAPDPSDDATLAEAERELRRWTGTTAELGLRKLHRFAGTVADGALVECRIRLRDLASRVPGLHLA